MAFDKLTHRHIAIVLASLFFLLATTYSLLVPIFEGPDEKLHYPYVKHLADGKGLPVAGRDMLVKQAATQGPLFYTIAAAVTFWMETDNLEVLLDYNPHWLGSEFRGVKNNRNYVVPSPADTFPYQGAARAVHLSRLISILFGALTVVCTVLIAEELFPGQTWLALGAAGLTAFNPQFVYVSSNVSNDPLAAALVAWLVLLALRWGRNRLGAWQIVGLGLLAGLAILTKLNGIIGVGLAALALVLRKPGPVSYRTLWGQLIGLGLLVAGLTGWWFARNWLLYGDLTATDIHLSLSQRGDLGFWELVRQWPELERTFWAAFGRGQIRVDRWIYTLLRWVRYIALGGLVVYFIRAPSKNELKGVGFLGVWLLVELALLFRWFSMVGSVSHARLLFPALPAIAILGMLGLGQWVPNRRHFRLWLAGGISAAFFIFAIASLVVYILPAFRPPPPIQRADIPADLPELNLTYAHGLRLITADLPEEGLEPGQTFEVDFFWAGVGPLDKNYSVFIRLLEPDGAVITGLDTYPGLGLRPTKYWPPDQIVKDTYPLTLPADFDGAPVAAEVRAGLFDFKSETREGLPAINAAGQEVTPAVGWVKIVPPIWPETEPRRPLRVEFADHIHLAGYDWLCAGACTLTLYWTPAGAPTAAYTIFIQHWLSGEQVGGFDAQPLQGRYPTNWWAGGEVIVDAHSLPLLTEGTLLVGLYNLETGARLPIIAADVENQTDGLVIEIP